MGNVSKLMCHVVNVPVRYVAKIAHGVEKFQYWIAEAVSCVANGMEWCPVIPGDRVVVVGTGFMGLISSSFWDALAPKDIGLAAGRLSAECGLNDYMNSHGPYSSEDTNDLSRVELWAPNE